MPYAVSVLGRVHAAANLIHWFLLCPSVAKQLCCSPATALWSFVGTRKAQGSNKRDAKSLLLRQQHRTVPQAKRTWMFS